MAESLWSDPYQNPKDTAAHMQAGYKFDAPPIGNLVAAILENRQKENALRQKQMTDMISGIGRGATSYQTGLNTAQAQSGQEDAANAAIYGMQYPNDAWSAYSDPGRVPDYGGRDALTSQLALQKEQQQQQLDQARINNENALANQRWQNPSGMDSATNTLLDQRRQQIMDAANAAQARRQLAEQLGVPEAQLPAAISAVNAYQPGQPFPAVGGITEQGSTTSAQGPRKDQILNAVRTYQGAGTQVPPPTAQPPPAPQGAGAPPSGSVRVVSPNGQAGTIPAERLQAYLDAGYRQL